MEKKKNNKRTNNDRKNITQKTKDWATWTSLNVWGDSCAVEGLVVLSPLVTPVAKRKA